MKLILKQCLRGWLALIIAAFVLCTGSFAATFNIKTSTKPALNHSNVALTAASKIEVYRVMGDGIDRPDKDGKVTDDIAVQFTDTKGVDVTANLVFDSAGNVDFFGIANITGKIYVRIWEASPGSGTGAYYVDKDYTMANTPVETVNIGGLVTNILNDVPPKPAPIYGFSEKLARKPLPSEEYDLQLVYSLTKPVTAALIDGYEVQVVKETSAGVWDTWPTDKTTAPNYFDSQLTGLTPVDTYFERGKKYQFRGRAGNHLGYSVWAEDATNYVYQSLADIAGPQTFILTLESTVPTAPMGKGINAFGLPFAGPWYAFQSDGTTKVEVTTNIPKHLIKTEYDLVLAINSIARSNVVSTFGKWDRTSQQLVGVMLPAPAYTPDAVKLGTDLKQGEGYQVYVSTGPIELMLKNTKD